MKKILVVDDTRAIRECLVFVFGRIFPGVEVVTASNDHEALEFARAGSFDWITMDGDLGSGSSMGGPEVVRLLRSEGCQTPILMASRDQFENMRGVQAGANASIHKEDLTHTLNMTKLGGILRELGFSDKP